MTTDGFLLPNAVLEARGLTARKGFPESYDRRALLRFVAAVKSGAPRVRAPVYSHTVYDVLPLASQMGYLPGTLWIIFGVVFAGAVQDAMVLFVSMRRDGKSLGDIVKQELGTVAGVIASIGILMIMVIIMAVLALIVVKALIHSPWGTFTIATTIPIALFIRHFRGRLVDWPRILPP